MRALVIRGPHVDDVDPPDVGSGEVMIDVERVGSPKLDSNLFGRSGLVMVVVMNGGLDAA